MSENVHSNILVQRRISLQILTVWSKSLLSAFRIAKDTNFLHADDEDSNQTAQMRRLICQTEQTNGIKYMFSPNSGRRPVKDTA